MSATDLQRTIEDNEEWLMARILEYAHRHGYTKYTSTLKEAWRLSISGLSSSLLQALDIYHEVPDFGPDDDVLDNPIAQFGVREAIVHRNRGVSLQMFFGLFKYYRQTYSDLLAEKYPAGDKLTSAKQLFHRIFDIMELGFCIEWAGKSSDTNVLDMQRKNIEITNEKNRYLTIFESIPNPIFFLTSDTRLDNVNFAGARFLDKNMLPGELYYSPSALHIKETFFKKEIGEILPWLADELAFFFDNDRQETEFEKEVEIDGERFYFRIKIGTMLDVSRKFAGFILILEDISSLKRTLTEVKTLSGLIPICAHCKKIRDDKGYWNKVEEYIESRSEAFFSHSIC